MRNRIFKFSTKLPATWLAGMVKTVRLIKLTLEKISFENIY